VLAITLLPWVAVPIFLLFGTRKLRGRRAPLQPVNAGPHHERATIAAPWAARTLRSLGIPRPVANEQVVFHADGTESLEALRRLISAARDQIDLSTYLWGRDPVGDALIEQLAAAARSGVRVRVLLDAFGGALMRRSQRRRLLDAGVELRLFMPLLRWPLRGQANARNHRKLVIGDGRHCWAGGRNLAAEYFTGRRGRTAWIDLTFEVCGELAAQAAEVFEATWRFTGRGERLRQTRPAATPGPVRHAAQMIASGPDQDEDTVHTLLLTACYRAEHRIVAVTPYFVPDDALLEALRQAARRGVTVELLLPARSNHPLADLARHRALRRLGEAGARISLCPGMMHAKAFVVDDALGLCGSVNLDGRSLFLNFESMTAFHDRDDIAALARWSEPLSAASRPYVPRRPGLVRDIGEGLLLWLAFQL
jgi:cardiolipin synthase